MCESLGQVHTYKITMFVMFSSPRQVGRTTFKSKSPGDVLDRRMMCLQGVLTRSFCVPRGRHLKSEERRREAGCATIFVIDGFRAPIQLEFSAPYLWELAFCSRNHCGR